MAPGQVAGVGEAAGDHDATLVHQLGAGRRLAQLVPELVDHGPVAEGPVAVGQHRVLLGRAGEQAERLELLDGRLPLGLAVEREAVELARGGHPGRLLDQLAQDPGRVDVALGREGPGGVGQALLEPGRPGGADRAVQLELDLVLDLDRRGRRRAGRRPRVTAEVASSRTSSTRTHSSIERSAGTVPLGLLAGCTPSPPARSTTPRSRPPRAGRRPDGPGRPTSGRRPGPSSGVRRASAATSGGRSPIGRLRPLTTGNRSRLPELDRDRGRPGRLREPGPSSTGTSCGEPDTAAGPEPPRDEPAVDRLDPSEPTGRACARAAAAGSARRSDGERRWPWRGSYRTDEPGPKTTNGAPKGPVQVRNPAASYSPRESPPKYHRRWWA